MISPDRPQTPCKLCVFAIYNGNTQVGCELNRIEKFKQHGANIIEAYDNDKEFYVIDNRICIANRTEKWGNRFLKKDWKEQVEKEMILKYDILIYVSNEHAVNDIKTTIVSVLRQDILPKNILIVNHNEYFKQNEFELPMCLTELLSGTGIQWRTENIVEIDAVRHRAIDIAFKHAKSAYYIDLDAGTNIPSEFTSIINKALNEDLRRFLVVTLDNITFVQSIFHKWAGGNKEDTILKKVSEMAKSEQWVKRNFQELV